MSREQRVVTTTTRVAGKRSRGRRRGALQATRDPISRMSREAIAFLKCAYAPFDKKGMAFTGVPDEYVGEETLLDFDEIFHLSIPKESSVYYMVAPTPCTAFLESTVSPVSSPPDQFHGRNYRLYNDVAGDGKIEHLKFSEFRCVSNAVELECMESLLEIKGSITVYRVPLTISTQLETDSTVLAARVAGLNQITNAMPAGSAVFHLKDGMYAVTTDRTGKFEWAQPMVSKRYSKDGNAESVPDMWADTGTNLLGMGNLDTIIIRVDNTMSTNASIKLRCSSCVSFKANMNTLLQTMAKESPPYDPLGLACYNAVRGKLPVATVRRENADFWERVRKAIRESAKVLQFIPGPIGLMAGGVDSIMEGLAGFGFG